MPLRGGQRCSVAPLLTRLANAKPPLVQAPSRPPDPKPDCMRAANAPQPVGKATAWPTHEKPALKSSGLASLAPPHSHSPASLSASLPACHACGNLRGSHAGRPSRCYGLSPAGLGGSRGAALTALRFVRSACGRPTAPKKRLLKIVSSQIPKPLILRNWLTGRQLGACPQTPELDSDGKTAVTIRSVSLVLPSESSVNPPSERPSNPTRLL